jgi:nitrogen fixation NifU-like protein
MVGMTDQGFSQIYQALILEHARQPRHYGVTDEALVQAEGRNPLCGDEVRLGLGRRASGELTLGFESQGCAICKASASILCEALHGTTPEAARALAAAMRAALDLTRPLPADEPAEAADGPAAGLAAVRSVRHFPVRIRCARLPWEVLDEALARLSAAPAQAAPSGGQTPVK